MDVSGWSRVDGPLSRNMAIVHRDREGPNLDLKMMFQLFNQTLALRCTTCVSSQFVLSIGSGAPVFIAEYDPFCALLAYMEVIQASCPISTSLFLLRASSTSHHMRKTRNNAFVGSAYWDLEIVFQLFIQTLAHRCTT